MISLDYELLNVLIIQVNNLRKLYFSLINETTSLNYFTKQRNERFFFIVSYFEKGKNDDKTGPRNEFMTKHRSHGFTNNTK
jgi:hypothetical protein